MPVSDVNRLEEILPHRPNEVLGGYDSKQYPSERIWATAKDGVKIPVSIAYKNRLSLLDRGVVFAIAHIRGGGEMGKPWHDDGKRKRKMNTFTDFSTE